MKINRDGVITATTKSLIHRAELWIRLDNQQQSYDIKDIWWPWLFFFFLRKKHCSRFKNTCEHVAHRILGKSCLKHAFNCAHTRYIPICKTYVGNHHGIPADFPVASFVHRHGVDEQAFSTRVWSRLRRIVTLHARSTARVAIRSRHFWRLSAISSVRCRRTSSTSASWGCSARPGWSSCWGRATRYEFCSGPLYNPSK